MQAHAPTSASMQASSAATPQAPMQAAASASTALTQQDWWPFFSKLRKSNTQFMLTSLVLCGCIFALMYRSKLLEERLEALESKSSFPPSCPVLRPIAPVRKEEEDRVGEEPEPPVEEEEPKEEEEPEEDTKIEEITEEAPEPETKAKRRRRRGEEEEEAPP